LWKQDLGPTSPLTSAFDLLQQQRIEVHTIRACQSFIHNFTGYDLHSHHPLALLYRHVYTTTPARSSAKCLTTPTLYTRSHAIVNTPHCLRVSCAKVGIPAQCATSPASAEYTGRCAHREASPASPTYTKAFGHQDTQKLA
jgi:hypothetical protein